MSPHIIDREANMPHDWDDKDLLKTPALTPEGAPRWRSRLPLIAACLVTAAGAAIYIAFGNRRTEPTPAAVPTTSAPAAATDRALGAEPLAVNVPPLDESDSVVSELIRQLSSHPRVTAWLATKGLIRNFTAVVTNIAEGRTPGKLVPTLRPASAFSVIERGGSTYVNPKSYERYTGLAEAVASVDPAGAARVYATLKPRIGEAYRDLGLQEPLFDHTLERAIVLLLRTPVPDDPIALKPKGIGYAFADPRLENLTAAQKQLLRTGAENARSIQRSLRAIALAIGIPPERLN